MMVCGPVGIRILWDCIKWDLHSEIVLMKTIYSRSGSELKLLEIIASRFPSSYTDGEIWFPPPPPRFIYYFWVLISCRFGRGNFIAGQKLFSAQHTNFIEWHDLRYINWDCPEKIQQHLPFERRYGSILVDIHHPFMVSLVLSCS